MRRIIVAIAVSVALAAHLRAAEPEVGFEQRIGQPLPMDAVFTGADGVAKPLRSYFGGRPVVLIFDYFRCPELCSLVASGASDALRQLKATAGKDFSVITISVDPTDTPQMADSRQRSEILNYGRTGAAAGWHVLVGKPVDIDAVAVAAGFHYRYDPRSGQYAHPSGVLVVTPKGIVSSYFLGIDYDAPRMAAAVRRAAENKTGTSVFGLLFVCFQGGSPEGPYGGLIWSVLSASVALTVAAVLGGIAWMLRSERKARAAGAGSP
jgi:protein SCO1/2